MVLYQGMYNVAHFEINNNLQLYEDVLVGDEYDYKRLRKICFVSGSVYINKAIVNGSEIKGGAHVTIQDDSIFVNIVPENESDGIVIGITFYVNETGDMYAYTEKRDGGPQGTIVESFNGRTGAVVPSDSDYNAGLIGYNNEASQLVAENVQDAIDELDQDIDNIQDEIEGLDAEHVAYDNSTSHLIGTDVQHAIDELDNELSGKQDTLTFDNTPTAGSLNPVTSDGVYHAIDNVDVGVTSFNGRTGAVTPSSGDYYANQIDYDNTDSGLAADDVQEAIDIVKGLTDDLDEDKIDKPASASQGDVLTFDGTNWDAGQLPTYDADDIGYDNTVSQLTATNVQDAVDELAAGKQDTLTFDSTPTSGSSNPVTSDGIYNAIQGSVSGVASFNGRTGAVSPAAHDYDADQVDYDNTTSGLSATDVQGAIDEVNGKEASDIPYDNTSSGMTATDVQDAIDEVDGKIPVITKGTTDLTPGASPLAENAIYLYYEP